MSGSGAGAKILYVDDEEPNLAVFEAVCGDEFDVITAASGSSALELLRSNTVSVVLTDNRMPGMTGVELLETISQEFPDTIRLLVTAYSDLQSAEDAINRGHARRYLRKPWEPEAIKAEIRDAATLYSLNQEIHALHEQLLTNERWAGAATLAIADEVKSCLGLAHDTLTETRSYAQTVVDTLNQPHPSLAQARTLTEQLAASIGGIEEDLKRAIGLLDVPTIPPEALDETPLTNVQDAVRVVLASVDDATRACTEVAFQDVPGVKAPPDDLQFVLLCALTTAVQRALVVPGGKGKVRVSTDADEGYVYVDARDNGPALSTKQLKGLVENPRSALTRAKGIALQFGGDLSVHQASDGNTVVRLALRRG